MNWLVDILRIRKPPRNYRLYVALQLLSALGFAAVIVLMVVIIGLALLSAPSLLFG